MPKDWNANDFPEGCFGLIAALSAQAQSAKVKVAARQASYIRGLPFHELQEEAECNEEYSIFDYRLRPTFDFPTGNSLER